MKLSMFWMIYLIILVPPSISWAILFNKMQEAGWKGLIPFYGNYTKFKLAKKSKLFIWHVITQIFIVINFELSYAFYIVFKYDAAKKIDAKNIIFWLTFTGVIWYITNALTNFNANKELVKNFGGNEDDALKMGFLPFIYVPVFTRQVLRDSGRTYKSNETSNCGHANNSRFKNRYNL